MNRYTVQKSFVMCLAIVACVASSTSAQMTRPIDPSYIAGDTFMLIGARPASIYERAQVDENLKTLFAEMRDEVGLEIEKIDQAVFQFGAGSDTDSPAPDQFAIVVHYADEISIEQFANSRLPLGNERLVNGRPLYEATQDYTPSIFFASDQTLVIAEMPYLETVANTPMTMSPVVSKLRDMNPAADLVFLFDRELVSDEMLAQMFEGAPPIGSVSMLELMQQVKSIQFQAELKSDIPITATIIAESAEAASEIETAVTGGFELARLGLPMLRKQVDEISGELNDEQQAIFESSFEIAEKVLAGTTVSREADTIAIEVEVEGGANELSSALSALITFQNVMIERTIRDLELDRLRAIDDDFEGFDKADR